MKSILVGILKGIGVVFAATILISGVLLAIFWEEAKVRGSNLVAIFEEPEYSGGFADREEMLDYLKAHPDNFSLVVRSGNEEEISYRPAEPSPLASTKKIVVLATYAKEVAEGRLDPEEEVTVGEWERYYIPNTDGGAHPQAMGDLGIGSGEDGFARDPGQTVTIDEMAGAMISVSDNAATDYLVMRLGQEKIDAVIEEENLGGQEKILPLSGSMLVWYGSEGEGTPGLAEMSSEEYTRETLRATRSYASGGYAKEWREGRAPVGSLVHQREMTARYETSGTAEDYAAIMDSVASSQFISREASRVMSEHLEWPMESESRQEQFQKLGAKGGSLSGVLTQSMYGIPRKQSEPGEQKSAALFIEGMSGSAWLGVTQSEGHGDFMDGLLTDTDFAAGVEQELKSLEGE